MTRLLTCAALLAFLAGCDVVRTDGPTDFARLSQEPAALAGSWTWVRSSTFWTGRRASDTPASTGLSKGVTFADELATWTGPGGGVEGAYAVVSDPGGGPVLLVVGGRGYRFGVQGDVLVMQAADVGDAPEEEYRRR